MRCYIMCYPGNRTLIKFQKPYDAETANSSGGEQFNLRVRQGFQWVQLVLLFHPLPFLPGFQVGPLDHWVPDLPWDLVDLLHQGGRGYQVDPEGGGRMIYDG